MVLPRPNLPNAAMPWGRAVSEAVERLEKDTSRTNQTLEVENRSIAGQMGAVGRQIQELGSRVTRIVRPAPLTVTANSVNSWSSATRTATIPGVGSTGRHALISVSSPVTRTGEGIAGPFATVSLDSRVMYRDSVGQSTGGRVPEEWGNSLNATFSGIINPGGSTINIQLQASLFMAGSASATLTAPTISVYFVDSSGIMEG